MYYIYFRIKRDITSGFTDHEIIYKVSDNQFGP